MGQLKGQAEYKKFLKGQSLTRKQAILAQCYACNGLESSNEDCGGESCPLYEYHPHNPNMTKQSGRVMTAEEKREAGERMRRARKG